MPTTESGDLHLTDYFCLQSKHRFCTSVNFIGNNDLGCVVLEIFFKNDDVKSYIQLIILKMWLLYVGSKGQRIKFQGSLSSSIRCQCSYRLTYEVLRWRRPFIADDCAAETKERRFLVLDIVTGSLQRETHLVAYTQTDRPTRHESITADRFSSRVDSEQAELPTHRETDPHVMSPSQLTDSAAESRVRRLSGCLFVCMVFNGTVSTNRLYRAIGVSHRAGDKTNTSCI